MHFRFLKPRRGWGFVAIVMLAAMAVSPLQAKPVAPVVDHHLHLGSPALSDYVEKLNKLDPSVFEHLSKDVFSRPTAASALKMLDRAGVSGRSCCRRVICS